MLRLFTVAASLNSSWKTHGLGMPYDAERVGKLRKMLVDARKRKLSDGLAGTSQEILQARPAVLNAAHHAPDRPWRRDRQGPAGLHRLLR